MYFHICFCCCCFFQVTDKYTAFILEFIEESEENQELSEDEDKHHIKTGEKPLSCSQTKQKDLKKRGANKLLLIIVIVFSDQPLSLPGALI